MGGVCLTALNSLLPVSTLVFLLVQVNRVLCSCQFPNPVPSLLNICPSYSILPINPLLPKIAAVSFHYLDKFKSPKWCRSPESLNDFPNILGKLGNRVQTKNPVLTPFQDSPVIIPQALFNFDCLYGLQVAIFPRSFLFFNINLGNVSES